MGADLKTLRESDQLIWYSETVGPIIWGRGWRKYAVAKGNTSLEKASRIHIPSENNLHIAAESCFHI